MSEAWLLPSVAAIRARRPQTQDMTAQRPAEVGPGGSEYAEKAVPGRVELAAIERDATPSLIVWMSMGSGSPGGTRAVRDGGDRRARGWIRARGRRILLGLGVGLRPAVWVPGRQPVKGCLRESYFYGSTPVPEAVPSA